MPGFQKDDDDDEKLNKDGKNSKKEGEKSSVGTDDYCKLNSLKEGLIGKIQIHKSGKAYLKLGNNILHIDIALKRCFRQVNINQFYQTKLCSSSVINIFIFSRILLLLNWKMIKIILLILD